MVDCAAACKPANEARGRRETVDTSVDGLINTQRERCIPIRDTSSPAARILSYAVRPINLLTSKTRGRAIILHAYRLLQEEAGKVYPMLLNVEERVLTFKLVYDGSRLSRAIQSMSSLSLTAWMIAWHFKA